MKIKKQFLNEKTLKRYGFEKDELKGKFLWYRCHTPYCDIDIDKDNGTISLCCDDEANIDNVVYHLIVDGLVEI